ncbi:uncharacterized protein LKV04_022178 [Tautogolabrus adspersus]
MRQAVEAQVLNPHCELGEHGLRQILTDVIEEVRKSVNPDIDGAEILHSLLNASWLQSLLKVYECLQRYLRNSPAPALDYASGLSLQLLIDIRSLPGCSEDAKELYRLLRQPHLQALLSAHDTVAQKDYEPVLPPMPEDLPDDEEATRIICLVKNKQPLLRNQRRVGLSLSCSSSPCTKKRSRGATCSHWDTLKRLTRQTLHRGGAFGVQSPTAAGNMDVNWCNVRRGSFPQSEAPCRAAAGRPYPPPRFKPMRSCQRCCSRPVSKCRVCYTNLLWEQNRSAPSVYSSVMIDNVIEELDSGDDSNVVQSSHRRAQRWTVTPPCLTVPYYSNVDDYLPPGLPQRLQNQSPCVRTAPPSPMRPRRGRVVDLPPVPPVELAKQESLDELRSTVQLAASSMESSTKDIKLLGEKMAAATERMSETVQDNSQALALLTQVVDRLQTLLTANSISKTATPERDETPKTNQSPQIQKKRPSLTHQSRCSLPSPPSSSSSSSSLSSSLDAPSTSHGTSCLSVSCHGSPRTTLKSKNATLPQKKHLHAELKETKQPQTNGLLNEPKETSNSVKGRRSQRRKKKKKKAT